MVSLISLKRSLVFPILLFSSISLHHWGSFSHFSLLFFGTLQSNEYIFPFLLCLSLLFYSQLFGRPPETTILPFCISFSCGWSWSLPPVQCHESMSIVLQALCLSDLIPWIYLSLPLYNHKGFDLAHTWMNGLVVFPTFFNLSLNWAVFLGRYKVQKSRMSGRLSRLCHGNRGSIHPRGIKDQRFMSCSS